jgi:hypothetical protein
MPQTLDVKLGTMRKMLRLLSTGGFALTLATSAEAIPSAPLQQLVGVQCATA